MKLLLFLLLLIVTIVAVNAEALTPSLSVSAFSNAPSVEPGPNSTSYSYVIGYAVVISINNQTNYTITAENATLGGGPRVGGISVSYGLGYGVASENYSSINASAGEPVTVIVPPNYVTVTHVENRTVTTTVTKTVTLANGSTTVITKVKTIQISNSNNSVFSDRRVLLGAGVFVFLFLLVLARKG